jgi:TPR repeat protein
MKNHLAMMLAAGLLTLGAAAHADVKQGVDAWNQGDYARAVGEWRPLALAGDTDAQFNMGQAYKLGRGVPVDLPVALEWFRKAAERGHEKASDNYGLLLYQQGRLQDAMPYIKASAERGEPRSQYVYATALFNGELAPRDWVRSYALMLRASQAGIAQATTSLTQMDPYVSEAQRRDAAALAATLPGGQRMPGTPVDVAAGSASAAPAPAPRPASTTPPTPRPQPALVKAAPAAPSPAAVTAGGRWRVQLGAFREQSRAPALWNEISGKVPDLSGLAPSYVVTNGLMRLLVGPLASQADARRLCARIKPTGTPCVAQSM